MATLKVNGKYVRANNGGDKAGLACADRDTAGVDETFTLEPRGGSTVAIRTRTGLYLSAEGGGGGAVHANRTVVGPWETWSRQNGGFLASDGLHYLCADFAKSGVLVADRLAQGPWETFETSSDVRPLHVDGLDFRTDDGGLWVWRGCTDFRLLKRFLDGEDIRPLLRERRALGANLVRVLGMARNLFDLTPSRVPNYYDQVWSFLQIVEAEGLRCEFVALADAQYVMPALDDQQQHVANIAKLIPDGLHVGELGNEYFKNGFDPMKFSQPPGLWSRGSFVDGDIPQWTGWTFHTWHGRRDGYKILLSSADPLLEMRLGADWARRIGARPAVHDEPVKFPSQCSDPATAYILGVTSSLYANGGTFHSDEGLQSQPFSATTRVCGEAFMRGLTVGAQR